MGWTCVKWVSVEDLFLDLKDVRILIKIVYTERVANSLQGKFYGDWVNARSKSPSSSDSLPWGNTSIW